MGSSLREGVGGGVTVGLRDGDSSSESVAVPLSDGVAVPTFVAVWAVNDVEALFDALNVRRGVCDGP